jgi:RHS repeat-associated protein
MRLVFFKLSVEFRCIKLVRLEQLKIFLLRLYMVCGHCPPYGTNLGLQYLRARYYNPSSGRFASTDPFEGRLTEPMSRHRYGYGNDNPISFADPSGRIAIPGEIGVVLSGLDILLALGASVWLTQIATALLSPQEVEWEAVLNNETTISGDWLGIPLENYDFVLTASSPLYHYTGSWVIFSFGTKFKEINPASNPFEFASQAEGVLYSPRWVGTNKASRASRIYWRRSNSGVWQRSFL